MYSDYITVAGSKVPVTVVGKKEIPNTSGDGVTVFKVWLMGHVRMIQYHEHVEGETGPETVYYCRIAGYNAHAVRRVAELTLVWQKGKLIPFIAPEGVVQTNGRVIPFERKMAS